MNFEFSEDQQMLRDHSRRFLQESSDKAALRRSLERGETYDDRLWQQMAELGWPGVAVPEELGGMGLGGLELCVLAEEVGRVLARTPFFPTVCLGAELLKVCPKSELTNQWLMRIVGGKVTLAVSLDEQPSVVLEGGYVHGQTLPLPYSAGASAVVMPVVCQGECRLVLVPVASGAVSYTAVEGIDELMTHGRFSFHGAAAELLARGERAVEVLARMRNQAAVLMAFEQVGGAQAACDMARDYALERYTFGRPIGGYQAIKHKLANLMVKIELARSNAYFGAWAMSDDEGQSQLPLAAAAARLSATEAFELAAEECLHIHGGIGYTWEADSHFYYKRARVLAGSLGGPALWARRMVANSRITAAAE